MPPLFVPASSSPDLAASIWASRRFFADSGQSNVSRTTIDISDYSIGLEEAIIGFNANEIGFITDLRGKYTLFSAFPDAGAGFGAGNVIRPFRSEINSNIYCIIRSAGNGEVARSTDNGASWTDISPPTPSGDYLGIVEDANGRLWCNCRGGSLHYSDNQGTAWTLVDDLLGATNRSPCQLSPDGLRLNIYAGGATTWASTTDLESVGQPTMTNFDMSVLIGASAGPGNAGSDVFQLQMCCAFNSDGSRFFGGGGFGDFFYTDDFVTFTAIPDSSNAFIAGGNVASTWNVQTVYSPFHEGWFVGGQQAGGVAFFPEADPLSSIMLPFEPQIGVTVQNGCMDPQGYGMFVTSDVGYAIVNLLGDFGERLG